MSKIDELQSEIDFLRKELAKFKIPKSYVSGTFFANMGSDEDSKVIFNFSSAKDAERWFDTLTEYGR